MRTKVALYALGMLLTGTLNTVATKYQDITVVGQDAKGRPRTFYHPAFQSAAMFLGEVLCLIPFALLAWRKAAMGRGKNRFLKQTSTAKLHAALFFALPAICDSGATTLLNVGLFYTFASVFQMLRGTLVIFAGLLTIIVLKRQLHVHHWFGIVLITAGAALVGASSLMNVQKHPAHPSGRHHDGGLDTGLREPWYQHKVLAAQGHPAAVKSVLLGDCFVVGAQLLAALQFIVEEKYLTRYSVPALLAVGLEGCWGLLICCAALPALSWFPGPGGQPLDSFSLAIKELRGSLQLQLSTLASILSIAAFNFFGISVTKNLSGAARATIDACRTLFVWAFSLGIGWERFHALEVLGFMVLISGTSVYNELLRAWLPDVFSRSNSLANLEEAEEPLLAPSRRQSQTSSARDLPEGPQGPHTRPQPIKNNLASSMLARSLRIFPTALSPHSLASPPPLYTMADSAATDSMLPTSSPSPSNHLLRRDTDEEIGSVHGPGSSLGRQGSRGGQR